MATTWLCILVFMFVAYAILDGLDFGAGIVHLFVARDERERMLVKRTIGPFWDGNEVWLIAGGGLLFMAFPCFYASVFSGFYLPLMLILWLFIGRGLSLELGHQLDNDLWRRVWDGAFGVCSLGLALVFGIAFGNLLRGVNLGGVEAGVSAYDGTFFFAPLWTDFVHPENPGVVDWFSLLVGVIAVLSLTVHGAAWVILKLDSRLTERVRRVALVTTAALAPLLAASWFAVAHVNGAVAARFAAAPALGLIPLSGVAALAAAAWALWRRREVAALLSTSLYIGLLFVGAVAGSYPVLLPSTNALNPPLTVAGTAAPDHALGVGLAWWLLGICLIAGYSVMTHWLYRGKVGDDGDGHTSYH